MSQGTHKWSMTNIRAGYLVVEGCGHCGARSSFFSTEPVPPIDDYREGFHFWSYLGSFQAVKFDLRCAECGQTVDLSDVNALMLSTCTDPDCAVGGLVRERGGEPRVYVAMCADNTHAAGQCVSEEGIRALNQYFNQGVDPDRQVTVVPCRMCNSIDKCRGVMIADTGLTELY
jgi:hypothetical protein